VNTSLNVSHQVYKITDLLRFKQQLLIDPSYQREGRIWSLERQQLLIDSILNNFEIPQIYLHRLRPPKFSETGTLTYAVVDGRQRLETIWDFADGNFKLARDFALLDEEPNPAEFDLGLSGRYGEMSIDDLKVLAPHLYFRFCDYSLPAAIIDTDDEQVIEELFFRLNEGVPLTPAEKRNRGHLLKEMVFPLVRIDDVFSMVRFRNRRQSHEDLMLRLLFLEDSDDLHSYIPDLKKRSLDDFAASFRPALGVTWSASEEFMARERLNLLVEGVLPTLRVMQSIFLKDDALLTNVSDFLIYYLALRELRVESEIMPARRQFEEFREKVFSLRGVAEDLLSADAQDLLEEFGQSIQGLTTGSYLLRRSQLVARFLRGQLDLE
jgi:hypothetical protein